MQICLDGRCIDHDKAIKQTPELLRGYFRKFAGIMRTLESADFQAFIQKQETITLPYKCFETILAGATEQKEYVFLERVQLKMLLDECRETINAFPQISPACLSRYQDNAAYAQAFFILIFMKSLLVSRESAQKDEDNIFTSIHTAGPSLLHRQAKLVFQLKKGFPFPSLPASYLLKARRKSWSFLSMYGQVFWK